MKVLVTGAAGLTGATVVTELLARGHHVAGVTRSAESLTRIPEGASAAVADCADLHGLMPFLEDADALVHVAGIRLGSVVARAPLAHLTRVLIVSTAAIYSRHASVDTYLANEDALRRVCPSALFVRPTMIYGSLRDRNVHRVIQFALRWRVLPLPDGGRALVQPIYYADLAAAIGALVDSTASGIVDIGGPSPLTVRQAAEAIAAAIGGRVAMVPVPIAVLAPLTSLIDRPTRSPWGERIRRMREDRTVDNTRLLELTRVPLTPFEAGVRREVAEVKGIA